VAICGLVGTIGTPFVEQVARQVSDRANVQTTPTNPLTAAPVLTRAVLPTLSTLTQSPEASTSSPKATSTATSDTIELPHTIGLDQSVTGSLTPNQGHSWLFGDGPATVDVTLDVGPHGDGLIIVLDSHGTERAYVDSNHADGKERLLNFRIPDSGNYTISVYNTNSSSVNYDLTVSKSAEPGMIGLGETVTGTLFYNEGNNWIFGKGPATVDIVLDVGPYGAGLIVIYDPDNVQREYVDYSVNGQVQLVDYRIPDDGEYRIFVRNVNNTHTIYTLTVQPATASSGR
jgi:hypothetical protein